jgi:hypothetical protein
MSEHRLATVWRSLIQRSTIRVAVLAVIGFGQGCTTWRAAPLTPETFPREHAPRVVRVTLPDGARLMLQGAVLTPDSLRGTDVGTQRPVVVPLSGIEQVETPHFAIERAIGLLLGLGLVVYTFIAIRISQDTS